MVEYLGIILENVVGFWVGALEGALVGGLFIWFFKDKIRELMEWD